jgi:hypothetical protein
VGQWAADDQLPDALYAALKCGAFGERGGSRLRLFARRGGAVRHAAGTIDVIDQNHRSSGGQKREPSSRMRPTTVPPARTS